MSKVWITSDSHYNHAGICRGTSTWDEKRGTRDFDTVEEMNAALVYGINKHVKEDDVLYHLGDIAFRGVESLWEFRRQLKVKTIHYIYGNHCHHVRNNKLLPNCHYDMSPGFAGSGVLRDGPSDESGFKWRTFAQNLFKSTQDVLTIKINGRTFFMSHYSHRVWDKSHYGVLHCFGHSHSTLDNQEWGRSMDIGADSAFKRFGEYRPFSAEEVIQILEARPILLIDHHLTSNPS